MVLPISVPNDRVDAVLHTILSEAISAEGAKAINERQLTQDGIPGVEIRATVQDGYAARFSMLISGTHVYFLGVHSKHATDRLYNALARVADHVLRLRSGTPP